MIETTLSIIKPDGVRRNLVGQILAKIEKSGLRIASTKMISLSKADAESFYAVHKERPFFGELVDMMSAGPVVVSALQGPQAVQAYRDLMGATDPKKAAAGTLRAEFAVSLGENTVHGSDSVENAQKEVKFFFSDRELVNQARG